MLGEFCLLFFFFLPLFGRFCDGEGLRGLTLGVAV